MEALVTNLIQNTNSTNIKNSSADPFWEKAEKMFLESLFLYVWMECPKAYFNTEKGKVELLQQNWKSILFLLDEAQFLDNDTPPKLDERMNELARKKPDHPAVKAYQRYRGGPDDTIRSVIMTVNARMQPFDNEELLEIFSSNDIPLDEFGTGIDGDGKTKSKYNVDFAVKKDKTTDPPKYVVFFKGRDADAVSQAFKEFVYGNEKRMGRTSIREKLKRFRDAVSQNKNRERSREKNKDRRQSL